MQTSGGGGYPQLPPPLSWVLPLLPEIRNCLSLSFRFQTWVSPLTQWKKMEGEVVQSPPPPSGRFKPAGRRPACWRLSFRVTAVQTARAARALSRGSRGGCSRQPRLQQLSTGRGWGGSLLERWLASSAPLQGAREIHRINTHFLFLLREGVGAL